MRRIVVIAFLAIAACKPSSAVDTRERALSATKGLMSGSAYLVAPIAKAHVTVHRLAANRADEFVADGMTDDDGKFDVDLPESVDGDLLITVVGDRGGSTIEPITGVSPVPLSENDKFFTLILGTQLGDHSTVNINPLTTLVTARALVEFRAGTALKDAWQKNTDLFSAHFDTQAPWNSAPIDLSKTEAPGLSSGVIYSLTTMGLSNWALTLGARAGVTDITVVNTLTLLRLLLRDLSDKVFDGQENGQPLNVAGNVFLETETTRLSLAKAIEAFLNGENNKTGLTSRDVSRLLNAIRQDVSELYPPTMPPQQMDETVESGAPPVISMMSPAANQALTTADQIVGYAFDLDGIVEVQLSIDGNAVNASFGKTNGAKWTWSFVPVMEDGAHVLAVVAKDAKGNVSNAEVAFSFDTHGPTVSFVECTSFDDRTRLATTSLSGASYASTATAWPCTETALNDGTQKFYTFSDLLESGAYAPLVRISVGDTSQVASATYRVSINDVEVQTSMSLQTAVAPSTHQIALSLDRLGAAVAQVQPSDVVSVHVEATDALGNKTTRTLRFRFVLLPTPLMVENESPDSNYALSSFSFAANNIATLFDPNYAFADNTVRLNQYKLTNVSSRPILLSASEGWSSATGVYTRRLFRSYLLGWVNENWSGTCANGQVIRTQVNCRNTSRGHQCFTVSASCTTLNDEVKPGHASMTNERNISAKVYLLPAGTTVAPDGQGNIVLAPGKTYRVVIGTPRPAFAWNDPSLRMFPGDYTSRFSTYACGSQLYSEGYGYYGTGPAAVADSFYKPNAFYTLINGTTYSFYGVTACDNAFNCSGAPGTSCLRGPGDNDTYMHAVVNGTTANPISPIILERGVSFATAASWTPQIRAIAGSTGIPAKGDKTGLNVTSSYNTEPGKPEFCAAYNSPFCGASLSGW